MRARYAERKLNLRFFPLYLKPTQTHKYSNLLHPVKSYRGARCLWHGEKNHGSSGYSRRVFRLIKKLRKGARRASRRAARLDVVLVTARNASCATYGASLN